MNEAMFCIGVLGSSVCAVDFVKLAMEVRKYMPIIISNIPWMSFNIFLALVPVLFGWLIKGTTSKLLRIIYGAVWIIFLPNTLYLLTDITHIFENIYQVEGIYKAILIFQYLLLLILGIITYFAAVYPAEKVFINSMKWNKTAFIIIINILVGFGMTLGRVERINSWDILSNISSVISASVQVLVSKDLLLLILLFTIMSTLIYLSLHTLVVKIENV
ncbi:MAG: DUF1361 domain-containing protein [Chloroflexota bacterium]|nr:DUF1361 domain-containing protein [Chloroflexota bacterium]